MMRWRIQSIALTILLVAAAGLARADGYQPRKAAAPPVMLQVTNWTGFYANGGLGYGFWHAPTTTELLDGRCFICDPQDHGGQGWLGEIGLGYDHQFTSRIVGGLFFNYDVSDMSAKVSDNVGFTGKTNDRSTWFVGARAGWLMTPDILNYWGVGYTHTRFDGNDLNFVQGPPSGGGRGGYDGGGWFLSGGLEVAMHGGWFWRTEARYAEYNKRPLMETFNGDAILNLTMEPSVQTVTSEIVYKFDWGH
jgi:outer membrane immunogenic protein